MNDSPAAVQTRKVVPCIVVVHRGRMLLLQRGAESKLSNQWCIPGGKLEPGETEKQCALRELKEETDISASPDDLLFVDSYESSAKDEQGRPYVLSVWKLETLHRPHIRIEPGFQGHGWFDVFGINGVQAMAPASQVAHTLGID